MLDIHALYSIVSPEDGKVLAYGVIGGSDSLTFAMTLGNWQGTIGKIAEQLLDETPLSK